MRNCTLRVAKTKALISFAVTAKLICVFVFSHRQIAGFLMIWLIGKLGSLVSPSRRIIYEFQYTL